MPISFEHLYSEDNLEAYAVFCTFVNDFIEGADPGGEAIAIDFDSALRFVSNLQKTDFPANGGFEKASPFKKAASIYICLHNFSPFVGTLPLAARIPELARFKHSTTSLIAIELVRQCLKGAWLQKKEESIEIECPIQLSKHFLFDLVEASKGLTHTDHFRVFSLLFEGLTYEANVGLSYDKVLK